MSGHPGNRGPPFRGPAGRGRGTPNQKFSSVWHGGPTVGIISAGSGPAERRYEDYQPNLEPGAYCDAPPEIRSVPPPAPTPQPRQQPSYDPNHRPGASRKRKSGPAQPTAPRPPKRKRPKKRSSGSESSLSVPGGSQAKGNQLAQFAQVNQANQVAAGNVTNFANGESSASGAAKGLDVANSVTTGAHASSSTAPSAYHQQRPMSWQQNNRDRSMTGNGAFGTGASQSRSTYRNHYDRPNPYDRRPPHAGKNISDPRNGNNMVATASNQQALGPTATSQNNLEPPISERAANDETSGMGDEPTAQQKQQWKAQVMAEHSRVDHRRSNGNPTVPGQRSSGPVSANRMVTDNSPSGSNAVSGARPSTTRPMHQTRQPPAFTAQTIPEQRKRKEHPSDGPGQRPMGPPANAPGPSTTSRSITDNDRSGARPPVSQNRQTTFAPPAGAQRPSQEQHKRHETATTSPAQVTARPQAQIPARLSPPPDRMLFVPSISYSATTHPAAPKTFEKTFEIRRATPDIPVGPPVPKPLRRVRRIMTPPGSELSLEERMNNDAIEGEFEIIPRMPTSPSGSSRDEERVPSRAGTSSDPIPDSSPRTDNSVSIMEEEVELARDDMAGDGELAAEEATILARLPANYAREKKRATATLSVDRNKGRTTSRGSTSSDVTADISIPVTSSSSFVRDGSEQARAEVSKGFSTVLSSSSSPAQTEAQLLSAMLPDLSIEIDEKQEYIDGGDVVQERELEAGAEFFPMPAGCARSASGNQSLLRENRRLFVRAQTVRLENECKVVKRTLWRSDGCALDWVLDRDNGTYREWWPAECTDRAAFAKSVSARCRSLGSDRRVLGVKLLPDVVEVSWTTIVEVPPPKAPKKLLSNNPPRSTPSSSSASRVPVTPALPKVNKPARAVQTAFEDTRQTGAAASGSNPAAATTTASSVAPEADDFALLTLWHGYRTNAPNDTIRQLAQERIDQIMKKIEENSRNAMM